jgi:hypothetical protein
MNVFNDTIIRNAVMNTNISSPAIPIVNSFGYFVQAVYTGTPTGSLKLQGSGDPYNYASPVQPPVPTNWNDIDDSDFAIDSAGICSWNVAAVAQYNYVRLVFTDASGGASTAILNVTFNAKGY